MFLGKRMMDNLMYHTWMERCSWGRDRRYLVASILGTPGGAQAKVTSLVSRLTMWQIDKLTMLTS